MASELNNEIDFLLRQVARENDSAPLHTGETTHLDADDLSAFAENTLLPPSVRSVLISHLADCNLCRTVLSNLVLLNETALTESAEATVKPKEISAAANASWLNSLKKFFAFPAFGYATAVLAVLLMSLFGFVALRKTQESDAVSVARVEIEQPQIPAKKRSSVPPQNAARDEDEDSRQVTEVPNEVSNANTEAPVAAAPIPSESEVDNLPPSVRATKEINRNLGAGGAALANISPPLSLRREAAAANSSNMDAANKALSTKLKIAVQAAPLPHSNSRADSQQPEEASQKSDGESADSLLAPQNRAKAKAQNKASNFPEEAADKNDAVAAAGASISSRASQASSSNLDAPKKITTETRTIGDKTFQKIGSTWRDADYVSQKISVISRGSFAYKKLDSKLRSITENLSGEVIIVWQSNAYRIR